MNPGLVIKLRPAGPWRIGPDSGARNKVDAIYHSDSLYSAVTSAMARLGSLEEWLDATARSATPAVCFSSAFPFLDEIGFVPPPRTVWPPTFAGVQSPRVRWKSARFVPLGIVQAILAGQRLDDSQWAVDGPSECLVPVGRLGPFRTGVRWSAAIDRLSGASERHSVACLEFRPGAGLWTVVSFADATARDRWIDPVKAAFRLLADSGFGGERSRGWGRAESPEFVEGALPEMLLATAARGQQEGARAQGPGAGAPRASVPPVAEPPAKEPPVTEPPAPPETGAETSPASMEAAGGEPSPVPPVEPPAEEPPVPPVQEPPAEEPPVSEPGAGGQGPGAGEVTPSPIPPVEPPAEEPPVPSVQEPAAEEPPVTEPAETGKVAPPAPVEAAGGEPSPVPPVDPPAEEPPVPPVQEPPTEEPPVTEPPETGDVAPPTPVEAAGGEPSPVPPVEPPAEEPPLPPVQEPPTEEPPVTEPPEPEPAAGSASVKAPSEIATLPGPPASPEAVPEAAAEPDAPEAAPEPVAAAAVRPPAPVGPTHAHWLLSLFTPGTEDSVDWGRGNYTLLTRTGRVDRSGELKKQLPMIAEGSVVYATAPPRGSAPDVAPDGCDHPVFRAGFALSIPLPEVIG